MSLRLDRYLKYDVSQCIQPINSKGFVELLRRRIIFKHKTPNNRLIISAEKHEKEEDKNKKYVIRESSSSFYRRIQLPKHADQEAIKADMNDGILTVKVPFKELPKPKKIAIAAKGKK